MGHGVPLSARHNYGLKLDRKTLRADLLATAAEGLGTYMFLLLAFGATQASITSNQAQAGASSLSAVKSNEQVIFIATSFGLSLLVSAWAFYRVSGSAFNPAVTLALATVGVLSPVRLVLYFIVEIVAAIAAAATVDGLVPGTIAITPALSAGTTYAQGTMIELLCTASLCFVVLMLAVEKSRATYLAPLPIGLTLFVTHLFAITYTGAGINPARAFGPAVVTGFARDQWIYWLGGLGGGLLAAALYIVLKAVKYWELNPGQDEVIAEKSPAGPLEVAANALKNEDKEADEPEAAIHDHSSATRPATQPSKTDTRGSGDTMV